MIISFPKLKEAFFSIILYFAFSLTCFSQSDFRNGYYITWRNDTVQGLIDFRGEQKNSKFCIYKKDASSKSIKLSPEEIHAYRFVDNKYYISKKINTSRGEEQVFVEFLLNGITNLYFFRDLENYLYLIEDENGGLLELFNETETLYIEGKGEVNWNSNNHIRLLKVAFADCMEIQPQVDQAMLTHKSLIKLTRDYHNYVCEDEQCIIYEKKLPAIKVQLAPLVGIAISTLRFDREFYSRFMYDRNMNPSFGIQVNTILPRVNERISLQLDVLYNKNDYYGIYNDYYELYINNSMLQSSLAFKYNFPKKKIRPSLAIGVAANFILNPEITALVLS